VILLQCVTATSRVFSDRIALSDDNGSVYVEVSRCQVCTVAFSRFPSLTQGPTFAKVNVDVESRYTFVLSVRNDNLIPRFERRFESIRQILKSLRSGAHKTNFIWTFCIEQFGCCLSCFPNPLCTQCRSAVRSTNLNIRITIIGFDFGDAGLEDCTSSS